MDLLPPIPVTASAPLLPLRFNRPAGWPEPSADWLAANQGWDPADDWAPFDDTPTAPAGWVWWSPDDVGWRAMSGAVTARFRIGAAVGATVFVLAAILTALPATHHLSIAFFFWGALIFGPIQVARNVGGLRRSRASFLSFVRNRASEVRQSLDTTTYRDHVARFGSEALPFDEFLSRRGRESWSFTGSWPADQDHDGVTEQFRLPVIPSHSRGRRVGTILLATLAGVALVVVAVNALGASQQGSGAESAAFGNSSATGGGTSTVSRSTTIAGPAPSATTHTGPLVSALVLNPDTSSDATCNGSRDCFVIRVNSSSSCASATLVVEFSASSSASVADWHETFTVPLTGSTYTDAAMAEPASHDRYAGVVQSYCSAS